MWKKLWAWIKTNYRLIALLGVGGFIAYRGVVALGVEVKKPGTGSDTGNATGGYNGVGRDVLGGIENASVRAGESVQRLEGILRDGSRDIESRDHHIADVVADIDSTIRCSGSGEGPAKVGSVEQDGGSPGILGGSGDGQSKASGAQNKIGGMVGAGGTYQICDGKIGAEIEMGARFEKATFKIGLGYMPDVWTFAIPSFDDMTIKAGLQYSF